MTIHKSAEDYLEAMLMLKEERGYIRSIDVAEKLGVTEVYTVVTAKGFGLAYHDVFRRNSDGQVFRVTGNQRDSEAPEASTVRIGKVSAERWELPND